MDFDLTEEQDMIRGQVHKFAENESWVDKKSLFGDQSMLKLPLCASVRCST